MKIVFSDSDSDSGSCEAPRKRAKSGATASGTTSAAAAAADFTVLSGEKEEEVVVEEQVVVAESSSAPRKRSPAQSGVANAPSTVAGSGHDVPASQVKTIGNDEGIVRAAVYHCRPSRMTEDSIRWHFGSVGTIKRIYRNKKVFFVEVKAPSREAVVDLGPVWIGQRSHSVHVYKEIATAATRDCELTLRNCPEEVTDTAIHQHFKGFNVENIHRHHSGSLFVRFPSPEDAQEALAKYPTFQTPSGRIVNTTSNARPAKDK
eukprot:NODE_3621_length_945_cov_21.426339_g3326_i0.p1 GENE.NODE_3621_length_945_cov_21.426339_g3326_i0~~NODE_3621_length_945_cov_21.426339_g3326_i0.p1  ORF type:complete len:261 (-),score=56.01 NODE_3621_length_945_cov_21.426339_g3326_i0:93-875(-)